jgi:hypothetical protein
MQYERVRNDLFTLWKTRLLSITIPDLNVDVTNNDDFTELHKYIEEKYHFSVSVALMYYDDGEEGEICALEIQYLEGPDYLCCFQAMDEILQILSAWFNRDFFTIVNDKFSFEGDSIIENDTYRGSRCIKIDLEKVPDIDKISLLFMSYFIAVCLVFTIRR